MVAIKRLGKEVLCWIVRSEIVFEHLMFFINFFSLYGYKFTFGLKNLALCCIKKFMFFIDDLRKFEKKRYVCIYFLSLFGYENNVFDLVWRDQSKRLKGEGTGFLLHDLRTQSADSSSLFCFTVILKKYFPLWSLLCHIWCLVLLKYFLEQVACVGYF